MPSLLLRISEAGKPHLRQLLCPKREPRRHRTGRNVQFNVKASQETVDAFYAISDRNGWVLGETLEHALAALQREVAGKGREGASGPPDAQ